MADRPEPPGRAGSLARIAAVYAAALWVAWIVFAGLGVHPLVDALAGMVAAMAVTFAATLVWRNGSVFDAYWSVVPPIVALYLAGVGESLDTPLATALILVVFTWAL